MGFSGYILNISGTDFQKHVTLLDVGGAGSICIFGGFSSTVPFFLLRGALGFGCSSFRLSSLLSAVLAGCSVTVNSGSFMARRLEIRFE